MEPVNFTSGQMKSRREAEQGAERKEEAYAQQFPSGMGTHDTLRIETRGAKTERLTGSSDKVTKAAIPMLHSPKASSVAAQIGGRCNHV